MKQLLMIAMLLPLMAAAGNNFVWYGNNNPAAAGQLYNLNVNVSGVGPGDTIRLKGNYTLINIQNLIGMPGNPVVIKVDSGMRVGVNTMNAYGMIVVGSWWEFIGDSATCKIWNDARIQTQNFVFGSSDNFKVSGLHLRRGQAGVFGNDSTKAGDRGFFIFENIVIEDGGVVSGATQEGFYIGNTALVNIQKTFFSVGIIRNCRIKNMPGDGWQVTLTRGLIVDNVTVTNYGTSNFQAQRAAGVIGGSTQGVVRNCTFDGGGGGGSYLQVFGYGNVYVQNCQFINGAAQVNVNESGGPDGVYIQRNGNTGFDLNVYISNTSIGGAVRNAIRNVNAARVELCNVSMSSSGPLTSGANFFTTTNCFNRGERLDNRRSRITNKTTKLRSL